MTAQPIPALGSSRKQRCPAAQPVPLFVDVDGTLLRADLSIEAMVHQARAGLAALWQLICTMLAGRAAVKTLLARRVPVDAARLPYRQSVLDLIAEARAAGRPVVLASASHRRPVAAIARHLGLTDPVIASSRRANLKGATKLAAIHARIGPDGTFDYVGDSAADLPLWQAARRSFTVGLAPPGVERLATREARLPILLRAMRPHQWAKNALVLVPLAMSGQFLDPLLVLKALVAAVAMSVIASAIYLVNDVLDIDADRAHRTKWQRPLAHGDLSIPAALGWATLLGSGGLLVGWMAGGMVLVGWLLAYVALSLAYSLRLKAAMVADAIALASLYTIRIWIGGAAVGVTISYWLLLFSIFLFLSLAYLKRYIEIQGSTDLRQLVKGRGYVGGDLDLVMASGVAAGMVAILVLALFAHDPATMRNYAAPDLLMLACLPLLYWLNRVWIMARRGEVEGDPVAFALRDRRSLVLGAMIGAIFLAALVGPEPLLTRI
ncbi:MAG: UbiA family prenyltransferase [Novosphingobium sp.]|nr:UbiA family prenyltransferase [Novosphingobium sp.]